MNKGNKNKKYSHMLGRTPKIQPKELYIADSIGNLRRINRGEVTKEGLSFDTLKKMEQERTKELQDKIEYIDTTLKALQSIFTELGYNYTRNELKSLTSEIKGIIEHINHTIDNYGVELDELGYVKGVYKINHIIHDKNSIPSDYDRGYWKFIDGKFILDEEKLNQLWGLL